MGMEELVNKRLNKVGDGNIYAYEFLLKLGRGGFGQVWKVRRDGKEYALKAPSNADIRPGYLQPTVEPPNLEIDAGLIEREAKTWARLTDRCPDSVVCLLDFNTDPFPWMLMELAETDLNTELKKGEADIHDFSELLIKLQKIHEINVVHRDIKPCNILKVDGEWKFSDFGLSKVLSGTSSGMGYGTPYYMAPEQVWREEYGNTSRRTDIWAMGIMLMKDFLELDPYPDSDPRTIYPRIVMEGPDQGGITGMYIPSLDKALKMDQGERFNDCLEFLTMMPFDDLPDWVTEEYGISGIHPIDEEYVQYWTYDYEEKIMEICGTGSLEIRCPEGINPKEVIINEGITKIVKCNFKSSKKIIIPKSVTTIGFWAFPGCKSLQSIDIPSSVESIYRNAFPISTSLKSIKVDPDNKYYCDIEGCLYNRDTTELIIVPVGIGKTEFIIPQGVTSIGNYAFSDCTSIESIILPNTIASIGDWAFDGCTSLQSIEIPSGVKSLEVNAFPISTSLKSIKVDPDNKYYCDIEGCLYNRDTTELIIVPVGIGKTEFIIPQGVTSIGNYAFSDCTSIESIILPNTITSIGEGAFYECTSLQSIEIPSGVTSIGDWAFKGCTSLKEVKLPSGVEIGEGAFDEVIVIQWFE